MLDEGKCGYVVREESKKIGEGEIGERGCSTELNVSVRYRM